MLHFEVHRILDYDSYESYVLLPDFVMNKFVQASRYSEDKSETQIRQRSANQESKSRMTHARDASTGGSGFKALSVHTVDANDVNDPITDMVIKSDKDKSLFDSLTTSVVQCHITDADRSLMKRVKYWQDRFRELPFTGYVRAGVCSLDDSLPLHMWHVAIAMRYDLHRFRLLHSDVLLDCLDMFLHFSTSVLVAPRAKFGSGDRASIQLLSLFTENEELSDCTRGVAFWKLLITLCLEKLSFNLGTTLLYSALAMGVDLDCVATFVPVTSHVLRSPFCNPWSNQFQIALSPILSYTLDTLTCLVFTKFGFFVPHLSQYCDISKIRMCDDVEVISDESQSGVVGITNDHCKIEPIDPSSPDVAHLGVFRCVPGTDRYAFASWTQCGKFDVNTFSSGFSLVRGFSMSSKSMRLAVFSLILSQVHAATPVTPDVSTAFGGVYWIMLFTCLLNLAVYLAPNGVQRLRDLIDSVLPRKDESKVDLEGASYTTYTPRSPKYPSVVRKYQDGAVVTPTRRQSVLLARHFALRAWFRCARSKVFTPDMCSHLHEMISAGGPAATTAADYILCNWNRVPDKNLQAVATRHVAEFGNADNAVYSWRVAQKVRCERLGLTISDTTSAVVNYVGQSLEKETPPIEVLKTGSIPAARSPIYDVAMWVLDYRVMTIDTVQQRVAMSLKFGLVIARLWEVVPKTRLDFIKNALTSCLPKLSFQSDGAPDQKTWQDVLSRYLVPWEFAKEGTKYVLARLVSVLSVAPVLWASHWRARDWNGRIDSVCKVLRNSRTLDNFIDTIFDVLEGSITILTTGRLSFGKQGAFADVETEYSALVKAFQEIGETRYHGIMDCIAKAEVLRMKYLAMQKAACKHVSESRHVTDRVTSILDMQRTLRKYEDNLQNQYVPYVLQFSGEPGVGKSMASIACSDIVAKVTGFPKVPGSFDPDDAYDSSQNSATTALFADDVGKEQAEFVKRPWAAKVIKECTSTPTMLVKAELEAKGEQSHLRAMFATSNRLGCGLEIGINDARAAARRVKEFYVTVDETKADKIDGKWVPKVKHRIPVPAHCMFQRVEYQVQNAPNKPTGNIPLGEFRLVGPRMNWDDMRRWFMQDVARHHAEQIELVEAGTRSRDIDADGNYLDNAYAVQYQAGLRSFRTIKNKYMATWVTSSLEGYIDPGMFPGDDEALEHIGYHAFIALVSATLIALNICVMGMNPSGYVMCAVLLNSVKEVVKAIVWRERQYVMSLTEDEKVNVAQTNVLSHSKRAIVAGTTVVSALVAIRLARSIRVFQNSLPSASEEAEASGTDTQRSKLDLAHAEQVEKAKRGLEVLKRSRDGNIQRVSEIKAAVPMQGLAQKLGLNIDPWVPAVRIYPSSLGGSGMSDDDLCKLIFGQTYVMRRFAATGPSQTYYTVIYLRQGMILMNYHFMSSLVDGDAYEIVRLESDVYNRKTVLFHKCDTRHIPGTDLLLWKCPVIVGRARNLLKYMADDLEQSHGNEGRMMWPTSLYSAKPRVVQVEISPNGREFVGSGEVIKGVYRATLPEKSFNGLCGYPVVVNRAFIGIHFAGTSSSDNRGFGTLVSKKILEPYLSEFPEVGDRVGPDLSSERAPKRAPVHPKAAVNFVAVGPPVIHENLERLYSPGKTEYMQNPYASRFETLLGYPLVDKFQPPRQKESEVFNRMLTITQASKSNPPTIYMDLARDQFCKGLVEKVSEIFDTHDNLLRRPIGISSSINGILGHPFQKGVDTAKGSSFPYNCKKAKLMNGEKPDLTLIPELEHDVLNAYIRLNDGEATGCVGNILTKDEPLLVDDFNKQKNTRGHVGMNVIMHVLSKMYFSPVMDVMLCDRQFFCHVIGVDPGSREWDNLCSYMAKGDVQACMSNDFGSFDLTHSEALNTAAVQVFASVAKCLDYEPEDIRKLEILLTEQMSMYVKMGGAITELPCLWPSGILVTAAVGALKSVLMVFAAYSYQLIQSGMSPDEVRAMNFREHINITALGDDHVFNTNVGSVPADVKVFDKFFNEIAGMLLTPDDKVGDLKKVPWSEVSFLSRRSRYHEELGYNVGCIKLDSLYRPLSCCKKSSRPLEMLTDIARNGLRECALHGRDMFNRYQKAFRVVFSEQEFPSIGELEVSYDEYIEMMLQRENNKLVYQGADSDDPFDANDPIVNENEVREVADAPVVESTQTDVMDQARMRPVDSTRGFPSIVNRTVLVGIYSLELGQFRDFEIDPLLPLIEDFVIGPRLSTYSGIQFTLRVTITVTGSKFNYGSLIASNYPLKPIMNFQDESNAFTRREKMCLYSQRNHVKFQIGAEEQVAELDIPFFYPDPFLPAGMWTAGVYTKVDIATIVPIESATENTSAAPSVAIYTSFLDIKGIGHTPVVTQMRVPDQESSKPSAILSKMADMADGVSQFPGVKVPAEVASMGLRGGAMAARMFGHSRPLEIGGEAYIGHVHSPLANANTDIAARSLTYDVHQNTAVGATIGGHSASDELSYADLCSHKVIVDTFAILPQQVGLTQAVVKYNVTPFINCGNLPRVVIPPMSMVAASHSFWWGVMCYRFNVVCPGIVGGKIIFTYDAFSNRPINTLSEIDSMTIDLKNTRTCTVRANWMQPRNLLRTTSQNTGIGLVGQYSTSHHNGSIGMYVLQPLVGTTDSTVVYVYVEAWMEKPLFIQPDYEWMNQHKILGVTRGRREDGDIPIDGVDDPIGDIPPMDDPGILDIIPETPNDIIEIIDGIGDAIPGSDGFWDIISGIPGPWAQWGGLIGGLRRIPDIAGIISGGGDNRWGIVSPILNIPVFNRPFQSITGISGPLGALGSISGAVSGSGGGGGIGGVISSVIPGGGLFGRFRGMGQGVNNEIRTGNGMGADQSYFCGEPPALCDTEPPIQATQQPTPNIFGTPNPTQAPTSHPSLRGSAMPSQQPSTAPTQLQTFAPTTMCSAIMKSVPVEWLAALDTEYDAAGVIRTTANRTRFFVHTYAALGELAFEVKLSNAPTSYDLPDQWSELGAGWYRFVENMSTTWRTMQSSWVYLPVGTIIEEAKATIPAGTRVAELDPTWMQTAEWGGITTIDNSTIVQTGILGAAPTSAAIGHYIPPECDAGGSPAVISYVASDAAITYDFDIYSTLYPPRPNGRVGGIYIFLEEIGFQSAEEDEGVSFEVGLPTDLREHIMKTHGGEHLTSMLQHIKVFRPSTSQIVTDADDWVTTSSMLHMDDSVYLTPFQLLFYSFLGVKGSMISAIRIRGEGMAFAHRSRPQSDSRPRSLLSRGYEVLDTRVNPGIIVRYPWYSENLFDLARGVFANAYNWRGVSVRTSGGAMQHTEDICVGEDFELFVLLGVPALLPATIV